jgi:hypothetical protein
MKIINIVLLLFLMTSLAIAQNYQIDWYVMASGGGEMASTSYNINGTAGQPIVGKSQSSSYIIESGFWVGSGVAGGCDYVTGDVNGSGSYNGLDITYGVNFFKGGSLPLCAECPPCAGFHYCGDVNASCSYNGLDITYGVNYFKGGAGPLPCGDCPPSGLIVTSAPGQVISPASIPNTENRPMPPKIQKDGGRQTQ